MSTAVRMAASTKVAPLSLKFGAIGKRPWLVVNIIPRGIATTIHLPQHRTTATDARTVAVGHHSFLGTLGTPPQFSSSSRTMTTGPAPGGSAAVADPRVTEILDYWFNMSREEWFTAPTKARDDEMRDRFGALVEEARTSPALEESWTSTPQSTLALLLLLDQIPRNIYRGSGNSFSSDQQACRIATEAIAKGFDRQLASKFDSSGGDQGAAQVVEDGSRAWMRRMFMYLPLMHAEDLTAQVACSALFEVLLLECPESVKDRDLISTPFAYRHRDCVLRHGRFPKRNEWLGRESTPAEKKFLEENPAGF